MNTNPYHVPEGQVKIVCSTCQSEDIKMDAYASWNFELQMWEAEDVFLNIGICNKCDGETRADVVTVNERIPNAFVSTPPLLGG